MTKHFVLILTCFLFVTFSLAQKPITNQAIWEEGIFRTNSVPGFNFLKDGRHYTRLVDGTIKKYDVTTGEWVEDMFSASALEDQWDFNGRIDRFTFSEDEQKLLIVSETDRIYRRSFRAKYHVVDLANGTVHSIFEEGKVMNATFSPDGKKVAYVYQNDLSIKKNISSPERRKFIKQASAAAAGISATPARGRGPHRQR